MPEVSENAKNITEKFIEDTGIGIGEYDSIVKYVAKSLDKLGDVITENVIRDAVSSYDDGKIQNPAAALISLIKKEIQHARQKPQEEPAAPKKKYSKCPNCGNPEASSQTCTRCGWLAPDLIPCFNMNYNAEFPRRPRDTTPITVDPDLAPANLKNLLCQVFRIPQNCEEANFILTEINYLRTKTDQQTTIKTVRKLAKDHAIGLVHHPVTYTNITVKNAVENFKNQ